ncbi:helix-turn-helix transcriptional regulator [Luteimicrobium sp. NPDC057192]|uniref:helix-turn-helix transcriptional regulator n=1 Tax=Luteimicrobium sp. NPDC057192 TaxID=3346042 RepID=UPI00363FAFD1
MNRDELARALRRWRERLAPADLGLSAGVRRRTPGLRREEVALVAGVSVDYVVRLEQGRGPRPSEQVLASLARALRLDDDERDQLYHLAGSAPPAPGRVDTHVRPSVQRLLDRLADLPTMVMSAKSDVLAWNAMSSALLGDWAELPARERNLARMRFLGVSVPRRGRVALSDAEHEETSAQTVASLRSAAARYPTDPDLAALVRELRAGSEEFARLWDSGITGHWRSHRKTIDHDQLGLVTLDCDTLHVPDSDQSVIVYSAGPGTPEAEALALLRVVGTQDLNAPAR